MQKRCNQLLTPATCKPLLSTCMPGQKDFHSALPCACCSVQTAHAVLAVTNTHGVSNPPCGPLNSWNESLSSRAMLCCRSV